MSSYPQAEKALYDEEKGDGIQTRTQPFPSVIDDSIPNAISEDQIAKKSPLFRWMGRLFSMGGVEVRGIERVPENERSNKHILNLLIFWWSVNSVLTTVPIGFLAQGYFTLSFAHAVAAIVVFTALGAAACGFIATLGPQTGLRTMVVSRYSVGYVGGILFSILNILTQIGFSTTGVILGGQVLNNISGKLPLVVGVILVALCALIVCFFGYNVLHHYERYAWIVMTIIFICMYALGGKAGYDINAQKALEDTGSSFAGDFLSFGGIVFSSAAGWAPIAADYNVRLPANTKPAKVFWMTWFGLMVPLVFIETLGALLMTNVGYATAFEEGEAGALIAAVFEPWGGGGSFLLVVLTFSLIGSLAPNTYSAALSCQCIHPIMEKIPRAIWTIVIFLAYTLAGVFGREHFSLILSNFLAILGYWIAFFIVILALEHLVFRRWMLDGYDLNIYDSARKLPLGLAGILAMGAGVAGAVLGMDETWYVGPIGKKIGTYGGDLGFELSFGFAGVVFLVARYWEIRVVGR